MQKYLEAMLSTTKPVMQMFIVGGCCVVEESLCLGLVSMWLANVLCVSSALMCICRTKKHAADKSFFAFKLALGINMS